jgi:phytoene dehydrogenase-like protein
MASLILKRTSSSKIPLHHFHGANDTTWKGSTHGFLTVTQMAYFRPANKHPRYQNLYFVGASTHPGTGIPTAMVSARLVSQRIVDEQLNLQ